MKDQTLDATNYSLMTAIEDHAAAGAGGLQYEWRSVFGYDNEMSIPDIIVDAKTLDCSHGLLVQGRRLMPQGRGLKYWSQDFLVVLADEVLNDEISLLRTFPSHVDKNVVLRKALRGRRGPCIFLNVPQRAGTLPRYLSLNDRMATATCCYLLSLTLACGCGFGFYASTSCCHIQPRLLLSFTGRLLGLLMIDLLPSLAGSSELTTAQRHLLEIFLSDLQVGSSVIIRLPAAGLSGYSGLAISCP